jgi:hypothetical protein
LRADNPTSPSPVRRTNAHWQAGVTRPAAGAIP